jgi:hypothetical protein
MYVSKLRHPCALAVAAAIAVVLAVPMASARTAFSGNVCSLLTAKQVAAVHVPSKCTRRTSSRSGSTDYYGTWGSASGPRLSVSVDAFQSTTSPAFKLATKYLGQLRNAKKVSGVGSLAWESSVGTVTMVNFVVGHDVCNLGLTTAQPVKSLAPVIALAKAIATKL